MKLKGVNPIEQHLEKIVLVAVSVVFLLVLALQFLGENQVKVGNQSVSPGDAFNAVEAKARSIRDRMGLPEPPQLAEARAQVDKMQLNLVTDFRQRLAAPVTPALASVGLGRDPRFEEVDKGRAGGTEPVAALEVPAPASPVAVSYRSTINPAETLAYPALKPLLPAEQPFDKAFVSVEARVDGAALKQALLSDPDGDGAVRAIPAGWWRDNVAIISVKLERQERAADGEWGEASEVARAPGHAGVFDLLKAAHGVADMEEVVYQARAYSEDLLRPAFYRTVAGSKWTSPHEAAAAAGGGETPREVERLVSRRQERVSARERVQDQINKLPGPQQPPRSPAGGGGGGGGKGGAGGAPPRSPDPARGGDRQQDQRTRLESHLASVDQEIIEIDDRLKGMGFDDQGRRLAVAAPVDAAGASRPLLENPEVPVWAHDMTVEAGKTYRYRVMVGVNNPAFGRGNALLAEQQDLAREPLVFSRASDWTEPVRVMADQYYFITGTAEPDLISPARASAELYRFFYGYYRKGTASLEPGDVLTAQVKLPDGSKLPVYDLAAAPQTGDPVQPVAPEDGRRLGKGTMPVGPGSSEAGTTAEAATLPANAKPWTASITAGVDVVLLDVVRQVGAGDGRPEAFLRIEGGQIEARDPDVDRTSELYRLVTNSAREGEAQSLPSEDERKAATPPPDRGPRPQPPTKEERPSPSSPGGGGTGGG